MAIYVLTNPSPSTSNKTGWAFFGRVEFDASYMHLYPGASASQYGHFPAVKSFEVYPMDAGIEMYVDGVLVITLAAGAQQINMAALGITAGEHLITLKCPESATAYKKFDYFDYSVETLPIMGFVQSATIVGPGRVQFNDTSSPASVNRLWDFGDGETSTDQNPAHTFTTLGEHVVTLTSNTGTKHFIVNVDDPTPAPNFTFNPVTGIPPLAVTFTATGYKYDSLSWDFGDGSAPSTATNPSHTFTTSGTFEVTQTATKSGVSASIKKNVVVKSLPEPDFSIAPISGLTVQFTDKTTEDPTGWLWDFADTDKTSQNPVHTFQGPGNYLVKLTATNANGSKQATKEISVTVTAPAKPSANFSSSVPNAGSPLALQFTDQSTGSPTSWLWDFGDGQTSPDQNPTHTYAGAGLFTVKLTATNVNGSATVSKSTNVQTGPVTPPASGAASPGTVPANKTARITLTGTGFKSGMKVRIIKPALWGVGKIVSFSTTRIVFDFFFGAEFSGACGVAVISTTGKTIMFENAITVS